MKKPLLFTVLLVAFAMQLATAQEAKPTFKKNSIQIGKTGYYFDSENPFGIEKRIFWLRIISYDEILATLPYIGYTRKFTPAFGMRVSVEDHADCYSCKKHTGNGYPPAFEVISRGFRHLQFNFLYDYSVTKKLSFILAAGPGYRWATYGELWYPYDYHEWADVTEIDGRSFHEWGIGGAFEVKYKFFRQFSLSAKGEYYNFSVRPIQHWGAGAYLGFDF